MEILNGKSLGTLASSVMLREAEPVSGVVFENRFYSVRSLGGFGEELDPPAF